MSEEIGRETFARRVGESVEAEVAEGPPVALGIDRVEDYGSEPGVRFSAFLRGPADRALRQGTYQLRGEDGEVFPVFLVPVGREGESVVYEAAFNRLEITPPG